MSDIFREVDEDLRRDRYKALWDKYGVYVLVLAAVIVVGTGGWRVYDYYQAKRSAESGDRFLAAQTFLEAGRNTEAAAAFDAIAADSAGSYPTLAILASAGAKAASGENAAAIAGFERVANDGGAPEGLRTIARLRSAYLLVDSADPAEIKRRVGDLATPTGAYRAAAREILGLAAWRAGDLDAAKAQFEALYVDVETTQTYRRRAQLMLQLIDAKGTPASMVSGPASATQ